MQDKKGEILHLRGKRVLVMGLGLHGGGIGTVKFLAESGAKLTVTDLRQPKILKPALRELAKIKNTRGGQGRTIRYVLGRHQKEDFIKSDLIVKNPGVRPDSPFLTIAKKNGVPLTSDLGIFFKNCPGKIIGVTGTRGKSTTAYLIWRFLQEKFRGRNSLWVSPGAGRPRIFLGGNIRKSVLALLPKIKNKDWVILELSSFQLHDLAQEKQSPSLAVITNIFPDHLNWHKNFTAYVRAKSNIFAFQKKDDYLFIKNNDTLLQNLTKKIPSKLVSVKSRLAKGLEKLVDQNLGKHYQNSVALAVAVAKHFGVGDEMIQKVLKNFKGLEGRQELIATLKGVRWINDTTSTIPEATIAAVDRFAKPTHLNFSNRGGLAQNTKRQLLLIAGGQDKKLNFRKLAQNIKNKVAGLILLPGTATKKLKKYLLPLKGGLEIIEVKSMSGAVKKAAALARYGDLVILSPGAASFGLFANEFDRGNQFVDYVNKLIKRFERPPKNK